MASTSWLLGNLHRNLLSYDDDKGLQPDLAESCKKISAKKIECHLKKNLHWNDGSEMTSADFLRTYQQLLNPEFKAPRADLLFDIKNAENIYTGEKKLKLGVVAKDKWTLRFELKTASAEFIYNLINPTLSPRKESGLGFSGPYRLKDWQKGQKIILEPNPFYDSENSTRPLLEFVFISEDSVALKLYEKKELQLLRRVPTLYISSFKNRPDFHFIPVTRFDYFGFGPALKDKLELRKALALSLNYPELQKIFSSPGVPGCTGLPPEWFAGSPPCFVYDKEAAQAHFVKVALADRKRTYALVFSSLGLEDHKRATEWMQSQWAQLGVQVNPTPHEHKIFLAELRSNTPDIFHEGIAPEHPTCLSALENFSLREAKDYLHFQAKDFEKILGQLRQSTTEAQQKKLCTAGVQYLLDQFILIPTGAYDVSTLIDPQFHGWRFNRLGQLDLGHLSFNPKDR